MMTEIGYCNGCGAENAMVRWVCFMEDDFPWTYCRERWDRFAKAWYRALVGDGGEEFDGTGGGKT